MWHSERKQWHWNTHSQTVIETRERFNITTYSHEASQQCGYHWQKSHVPIKNTWVFSYLDPCLSSLCNQITIYRLICTLMAYVSRKNSLKTNAYDRKLSHYERWKWFGNKHTWLVLTGTNITAIIIVIIIIVRTIIITTTISIIITTTIIIIIITTINIIIIIIYFFLYLIYKSYKYFCLNVLRHNNPSLSEFMPYFLAPDLLPYPNPSQLSPNQHTKHLYLTWGDILTSRVPQLWYDPCS